MPTSWRNWARAALPGRPTSRPQTSILPAWIVSSPAMQRNSVLLPDPLRPTMATVWPRATSRLTPSRTRNVPNSFTTPVTCTTVALVVGAACIGSPFEDAAGQRQRVAHRKIYCGHDTEDDEGLEGRIVDDLACARELDKADHRSQRRILHDLDHEANSRRNGQSDGLRQYHIGILLEAIETETIGSFPLRTRHRLDATTPDLTKKGGGIQRQRQTGRDQRRQLVAEDAEAEIGQEQQDQQRRTLDELDVPAGDDAQRVTRRDPHQRDRQTDEGATRERNQGQQHRPLRGSDE